MTNSLIDTVHIRGWEDSDFEAAVTLNREAEEFIGMGSENGDWRKDMEGVREIFLDSGGDLLLGFIDEKLIVMGGFKKTSETTAEVKRMRVTPTLQGKGIGKWLLALLESKMREKGITKSIVRTMSVQVGAMRLYGGSGYTEVDRKIMEDGPEKGMINVTFEKRL